MKSRSFVVVAGALLVASQPISHANADERASSSSIRVGGDLSASVTRDGDSFFSGPCRITTALPDGYPDPTPPGAIDVKHYPSVRRAEVSADVSADSGQMVGFWPLFRHIQRRDIAMTSPVEMDFRGLESDGPAGPDSWTMSFLYRSSNLGPTGADGIVDVVDTEPVTVVALGFRGPYGVAIVKQRLAELEEWVADSEYVAIGEPRALYYNGPEVSWGNKWGEVQLPVVRADSVE